MNRFRPVIETFEERCTPAFLSSGTLFINGGPGSDGVTVTENHDTNVARVLHNGVVQHFNSNAFDKIRVSLGEGGNAFNYVAQGNAIDNGREIRYEGGNSFDTVNIDLRGNARTRVTDDFKIDLNTRGGRDIVTVSLGLLDDADVKITGDLGDGNDTMRVNLTQDLLRGSDVNVDVKGGRGNDNISVIANADVDIDRRSSLVVKLDGGADNDTLSVNYRGEMDGKLNADLFGGSGDDRLRIDAVFDPGSTGNARLREFGNAGVDILVLNAVNNSGSSQFKLETNTRQN